MKLSMKLGVGFLALDAVFWILIVLSCFASSDCALIVTYIPHIYYQPISDFIMNDELSQQFFLLVFGGAFHFITGFAIGWVIDFLKRSIRIKE